LEKTVRVCTLENQAESEIVCAILDEQGIPYTLRKTDDAAYDGLYLAQGPWGIIEAPITYVDSIVQILSDVRESRSDLTSLPTGGGGQKKKRLLRTIEIGIPVLLILVIIVLIRINGNLNERLARYSTSPFMSWSWVVSEKAMVAKLKSTGQIRYKDFDRNLNGIYEERIIYSVDGKRITTYFDQNEDGLPERYTVVSVDGPLMGEGEDVNENGVFERETVYYSNNESVEYIDKDDDGLRDEAIANDHGVKKTIDIRQSLFSRQP